MHEQLVLNQLNATLRENRYIYIPLIKLLYKTNLWSHKGITGSFKPKKRLRELTFSLCIAGSFGRDMRVREFTFGTKLIKDF